MTVKGLLLAGASICALGMSPAFAGSAPHVYVSALRAGHAVVKTQTHRSAVRNDTTSSLAVTTGISASADYKRKTNLPYTFYAIVYSSTGCFEVKKEKVTLSTKKTKYAKLSTATDTSIPRDCFTPITYWGSVYDLTAKGAVGQSDSFTDSLVAKGKGFVYTLNVDVTVDIGS